MENWIILLIISLDVDAPMMCMEIMRQKYVYLYLSASWPIERIPLIIFIQYEAGKWLE